MMIVISDVKKGKAFNRTENAMENAFVMAWPGGQKFSG